MLTTTNGLILVKERERKSVSYLDR